MRATVDLGVGLHERGNQATLQPKSEVVGEEDLDAAAKTLEDHDIVDVINIGDGQIVVTLKEGEEDYSELPSILINTGFKILKFAEEEVNLESAFMALTKGVGTKI